jgi:hypothetical protein
MSTKLTTWRNVPSGRAQDATHALGGYGTVAPAIVGGHKHLPTVATAGGGWERVGTVYVETPYLGRNL